MFCKIYFSIFLLYTLILSACIANIIPDLDPCLPDNLRELYQSDAARLAIRWQQDNTSIDDVRVSSLAMERLSTALASVHKSNGAVRDTIVAKYQIHTLTYPAFDELVLEIDTTKEWTANWRMGNSITTNAQINALMTNYNLQLDGYFSLSTNFVILTTQDHEPLHLAALAAQFEAIDGIVDANFEDTGGDGNNITAQDMGSYILLQYKVGYDEIGAPNACNGACEFSRTWSFNVFFPNNNTDCPNIQFVEATGDPAP